MDFQKDIAQKILSICLVLFAAQSLFAQNGFGCTIDFVDSTEMNLVYFFEARTIENNTFVFNDKIPNFYLKQNDFVQILEIQTKAKFEDEAVLLDYEDTLIIPLKSEMLFYKIKLKPKLSQLIAVQTLNKPNNFTLINWSNFLGSFMSIEEDSISLSILGSQKKIIYQTKKPLKELLASPICLDCIQTKIQTENINVKLYFNQKAKPDSALLLQYSRESLEALNNLGNAFSIKNKEIILIVDSLNQNSGAIAHPNTIVFHLNSLDKFTIQKTLIHEYIHWLAPNLDSWLNESVAEYLALKLMLKANLISDKMFLEKLSEKMKQADLFSDYSLIDIFNNKTKLSPTENYKALYSKGAINAFCLDLLLQENTKNELSLESYALQAGALFKIENRDFLIEKIIAFENDYIKNNKSISYNQFLTKLGLLFERNKLIAIKAKQNIKIETKQDVLFIVYNANIENLQNGDKLIKLDGKKRLTQIREKLFSMSEKSSCFVLERDNKRFRVKISNKETVFLKKQFVLGFLESTSEKQRLLWEQFKK